MNIVHNFNYNGQVIQRRDDGFISLTQMCQANGKRLDKWKKAKATTDYIEALQGNYPQMGVVETTEGLNGGTWGHPSLAINLARWISPAFAVWCDAHIFNLMESGSTSLDIDPLAEMKLKIELAKIERDKAKHEAIKAKAEETTASLRHYVTTSLPAPIADRILGVTTIKEVQEKPVVIDKRTGEKSDGVGITYIAKRFGFKTTAQCWAWLDRVGYGKDSEHWNQELTAIHSSKLSWDDLQYLEDLINHSGDRQLWLGE